MKNYLSLNGKEIELTDAQVEDIKKSFGFGSKELGKFDVGNVVKIGEFEFVVLEHSAETTAVILKGLLHEKKQFGKNNNFAGSSMDDLCADFGAEIAGLVGEENLIEHTVDLTSDDGLKDYGKVERRMSLLTTELYRRYVEILDKHKLDKWWWLATAYSTPTHDDSDWIKCVSPRGNIYGGIYDDKCGVRPFCILKSNILVSK